MNTYKCFRVEMDGQVAIVTMTVPAMPLIFPEDLKSLLRDLALNDSVRAVLVKNDGRFFCAGGDLSGDHSFSPSEFKVWLHTLNDAIEVLYNLSKPTIALVNGAAAGGGCGLALSFDFIIASEKAVFREVSVNLNTLPDTGGIWSLMRHVGPQKAKELCMTADKIGAEEALSLGLLTKLVPSDMLLEEGLKFARILAEKPPAAITAIKRIINAMPELSYSAYREIEENTMATLSSMEDTKEGVKAFMEKRAPQFTGK